jgi:AcrR family transcriptional regulator
MNGFAIATTVPSSATMITPSAVATSVHQGLSRLEPVAAVLGVAARVALDVTVYSCVLGVRPSSHQLSQCDSWQSLTGVCGVTPTGNQPPGGLRERRKQSTRRALIDTALRLFDERGYGEVTVEDVCESVDVSPRTFFRYFPSKEAVLAEPIVAALGVIRDSLAAQPRGGAAWAALCASLMSAVDEIDERREEFLRSARVIRETPAALASSARALVEWEITVRDEVAQRLGVDPSSMPARLLLGTTMLALRAALEQWTDGAGEGEIRRLVEEALQAVEPGAMSLERAAIPGASEH